MAEQEFGEVISIEGPLVKVKMQPQPACGGCAQRKICFPTGKHRVLIAQADAGIAEGDTVSILFRSAPAIVSSLLIFVGSVFVPLAVWLITEFTGVPIWLKITSSVAALIVYWIFLVFLNNRLKRSGWFLPRALKFQDEMSNLKGQGT